MIHTIEIEQRFHRGGNNQSFEDFLDCVMDEFDAIGVEADYLATFNTLAAIWTISVDAESQLDALVEASTALRSALHAAQCNTPNWHSYADLQKANIPRTRGGEPA